MPEIEGGLGTSLYSRPPCWGYATQARGILQYCFEILYLLWLFIASEDKNIVIQNIGGIDTFSSHSCLSAIPEKTYRLPGTNLYLGGTLLRFQNYSKFVQEEEDLFPVAPLVEPVRNALYVEISPMELHARVYKVNLCCDLLSACINCKEKKDSGFKRRDT